MLEALLLLLLMLAAPALAGGSASPAPPPPPEVDFSVLPDTAQQRKTMADGKPHPVHARLLLDHDEVAAGDTVRVGLHLTQDAGWHTYWKSPGDIGLPTEIAWTAPDGVTVTDHVYPVPQRFEQDGQVSYGYDGQVLLMSELTVPAELEPGTYELSADANWLVCLTSCIPGDAQVKTPLVITDPGSEVSPSPFAPLFDHYAAQHPTDPLSAEGIGWDFTLDASAVQPNSPFKAAFLLSPTDGVTLASPADEGTWPTFTPIVGGYDWMLNDVRVEGLDDGRIVVVLEGETFEPDPLPTDDRIGGLVQVKVGDDWLRTEITAGLPWAAADADVQPSGKAVFALVGDPPAEPPPSTGPHPGTEEVALSAAAAAPTGGATGGVSLLLNLGFAFLGGLILNVMPCVLPVITLKLYGLVEQTDITTAEQRTAGTAYTGGILASFLALAATIIVLRVVFGMEVDWGFQFQYPPYVAALATIVFAFGLSLFGVFEIPAIGANAAGEAASKEGVAGYFLTGVFATLLATPCSAPFLGPAIAYAFGAPSGVLIAIFSMIGLGLAFPFLLIAFVPALYRFLPKPGAWMDAFKQLLGFTLIATTVWLVDVLLAQIGPDRTVGFLAFLMFVALGCWVFGRWGGVAASRGRQATSAAVGAAIALGGGVFFLDLEMAAAETCDDGELASVLSFDEEIPWQAFSEDRVAKLSGTPVFIDFTADWCLTCKVNENTILETHTVRSTMEEAGVVPLKADWTRRDPTITEWLRRHDRAGVPMYLVLPADGREPIVLPEVITTSMVVDALLAAR